MFHCFGCSEPFQQRPPGDCCPFQAGMLQREAEVGTAPSTAVNPSPTRSTRARSLPDAEVQHGPDLFTSTETPKGFKTTPGFNHRSLLGSSKDIFNLFNHFNLSNPSFATSSSRVGLHPLSLRRAPALSLYNVCKKFLPTRLGGTGTAFPRGCGLPVPGGVQWTDLGTTWDSGRCPAVTG